MQEREQVSPRGRAEESHLSVPTREIGTSEITETSEIPSKPKVDTTLEPLDDINLTPEAQAARAQALEELHTKRAGLKETLKAFGQLFSLVQKNNKLYFWADAAGEVLDTLSPYGYWAGLGLAADAALSGGSPVAGVALIGASMVWDLYSSTVGKYISSLNEQNQTETLYREYYRRLGDYPVQELQSDALRKGQTMAAENFSSAPELISDTFSSGAVIVSTAVATIAMVEASSQVLGSPYWAALIALPLAPRIWTEFLHARDVIRKEEDVANTRRQFEYGDWAFSDNTQLAEVKGLQQKDALGDQTMERYRIIKDADLKVERRDMFRNLPIELGEQAVQAGGLIVLIGALANGSLSYGEMMLPLYALYQLQSDFTSFSEHLGSLAQHIPFATKIMRLMNGHTNDEQAPPQVEHLDWNTGAPRIRIENLSVTHTGHSEPTLKNVDLVIEPNQIIGVVGPNGAGKSTFMGAIAGVFKPSGGAIIAEDADGSNPKNIHRMLPEWRTHRRALGQDFVLFESFTFRDLLEMGFSPYLPKVHDVEEVAKRTGIHDYIVSLPNGYDTIFGSGFDGACELPSGGQRQMIALTRTLMSDPKIVILDEPTANLDGDHEGDVTRFIQEHLKGKCTVFYITHDMGALRKLGVDQVVSVVDGAVAEVGTPEELLQREGGYFRAMFDQEKERYGDGSAESEDEYEE